MNIQTAHQTLKYVLSILVIAALIAFFFPSFAPVAFSVYFAVMAIQAHSSFEGVLQIALVAVFSLNAFVVLF